jgi:hypothetical protein
LIRWSDDGAIVLAARPIASFLRILCAGQPMPRCIAPFNTYVMKYIAWRIPVAGNQQKTG